MCRVTGVSRAPDGSQEHALLCDCPGPSCCPPGVAVPTSALCVPGAAPPRTLPTDCGFFHSKEACF